MVNEETTWSCRSELRFASVCDYYSATALMNGHDLHKKFEFLYAGIQKGNSAGPSDASGI